MFKLLIILIFGFIFEAVASENIIFIRHAEKPSDGLGQLSCKGLNRSLALPSVIISRFGIPDTLYAPNPTVQKADHGVKFNYIRPMATIEPLAIKTSKNIDLTCGFNDIDCISKLLVSPENSNRTILVAWEHHLIKQIISKISASKNLYIPEWDNNDFDSIYVLRIEGNEMKLEFQSQGLNGQQEECR